MSSSLSIAGPSESDAASSGSISYFMCKLSTKALGTCWETKGTKRTNLGQSATSGKAHVWHKTRKIGNIMKKNRQPITELLERKIGNFWSRLGSCLLSTLPLCPSFPHPSTNTLSLNPSPPYPDSNGLHVAVRRHLHSSLQTEELGNTQPVKHLLSAWSLVGQVVEAVGDEVLHVWPGGAAVLLDVSYGPALPCVCVCVCVCT